MKSKDCKSCIAYNIDHCAAEKCQGALISFSPRRNQVLDELLRKYYEYMVSTFQESSGDKQRL